LKTVMFVRVKRFPSGNDWSPMSRLGQRFVNYHSGHVSTFDTSARH
jgi:hypothetical protein